MCAQYAAGWPPYPAVRTPLPCLAPLLYLALLASDTRVVLHQFSPPSIPLRLLALLLRTYSVNSHMLEAPHPAKGGAAGIGIGVASQSYRSVSRFGKKHARTVRIQDTGTAPMHSTL